MRISALPSDQLQRLVLTEAVKCQRQAGVDFAILAHAAILDQATVFGTFLVDEQHAGHVTAVWSSSFLTLPEIARELRHV